MTKVFLPDQATLLKLLSYNPDSGFLTWKERPLNLFKCESDMRRWNTKNAEKPALNSKKVGCLQGAIFGKHYRAHRIIWKLVNGTEPDTIDHINGDPFDNRLVNLRDVSAYENMRNLKKYRSNSSGVTGVYFSPQRNKWRAQITIEQRVIYLGSFITKEEAIRAREAANGPYGYHANHGLR